ncbi:hypothetical protein B9Z55_015886 [Caenorhabditis nigoni]|uniref:F-box domain-containing protein n=1 Tax=Caenorhabditis nigoni TaxID=1611254 RepID=A0A2G5UC73_9PELO|nr:hypothetical protein B9Z55_015886 [Caenorhabditis nigoni]
MPFPILRTPFVVLSEIISLLEPNEIVTASCCSKNLKHLLKRHYQQRKPLEWRLTMIYVESRGRVDIVRDGDRKTVMFASPISELNEPMPISKGYVKTFSRGCSVLYFEDRVTGIKMIVDYVTDLLNLDVYTLEIDRLGIWTIGWINEWQKKMLVRLDFHENSDYTWNGDEALDYELRNARTLDLNILDDNMDEKVSDNFRFDGEMGPMRQLWINFSGHWVTLNNLINIDAISIVVRESSLSVPDLYSFVRHWRAGGSPRLKFLRLELNTATNFEQFEDEFEIFERDITGEYHLNRGTYWHFDNGYSIQRNDGVKAVIDFGDENFVVMVCLGEDVYDRDNYLKRDSDQKFLLHRK